MTLRRPVTTSERPTPRTTSKLHSSAWALAAAHAKAAELRMGRYKDVILSLAKSSEGDDELKQAPGAA